MYLLLFFFFDHRSKKEERRGKNEKRDRLKLIVFPFPLSYYYSYCTQSTESAAPANSVVGRTKKIPAFTLLVRRRARKRERKTSDQTKQMRGIKKKERG